LKKLKPFYHFKKYEPMKSITTSLFYILLICCFPFLGKTQTNPTDSLALVALYNTTDGANWTNTWNLSQPVNSWQGVLLNDDGRVSELNLNSNGLSGDIPSEIGDLSSLINLYLSSNQLTGNIPATIENLSNLSHLQLNENQLEALPEAIGNLSNLTYLYVQNNQLPHIPASIENLSNLIHLLLNDNQLEALPEAIGNLSNLTYLYVQNNQLPHISASIGNLNNLTHLYLHNNQLEHIPDSIGALNNLTELFLQNNQLSHIPASLGNLNSLTILYLHNNELPYIPALIGNLTNLNRLLVHANHLEHIPASIGGLTNLTHLWLQQNQLSSLPDSLRNLMQLKELYLSSNQIEGSLPNWLVDLENLEKLSLQNNQFSGDIPDFSILPNLAVLRIHNNKFSFDAIEATYSSNNFVNEFLYSPQYHGEPQGYTQNFADTLTFTLSEPLPGNNNQDVNYQWQKNSNELTNSTDSTYTINDLQLSDAGKYKLHMTDPLRVPDLEVISEPIYVIVPGYDLLGQPVEYEQLMIKFDDIQDKENYETNHLFPNGAFAKDSCSCNRSLFLYQFPNDTIALQTLININTKKESHVRGGEVDGGFNNILGVRPISGTQGWTWAENYPHNYPDSVTIFLLDSGADIENWGASPYLMEDAPSDSCYDIFSESGYDYVDFIDSIQGGFIDSIGHGTYGMRSIAEGSDAYMNMNIVPLKVFDKDGQGTLFNFICALYHAIDHGADIINISAGYTGEPSEILEEAIALAHSKGQFIITATGNDGVNIDSFPQYPAYYAKPFYKLAYDDTDSLVHYNNVISVAATDATDSLWQYSNYGSEAATLSAYGENMGGYSHTGEEVSYSGTSLSTYYVTRQLAAEIARNKTRNLEEIWADFETSSLRDCPATNGLTSTGKCLDISLREVYSDLRVFMEGAFDTTGDTMRTDLNTLYHILPGQTDSTLNHVTATQPYDIVPFDYSGTETVPTTFDNYPPEVIEWILISARTEVAAHTTVSRTAAWLLKDGRVQLLKPLFETLDTAPDSVYIVIEHRNHMGIMSPQKLPIERNIVTWDFTAQNSYAANGEGQVMLNNLYWGMLAGDTNNDLDGDDINGDDKGFWQSDNGIFILYLPTDFNMDGDVNGNDKIFWKRNNGKFSSVSRY